MSSFTKSRWFVVLAAVAAGVAVIAIVSEQAHSRVPKGPRNNSLAKGCGALQDQYDQAVRDYEKASKGTPAEFEAAKARLISIIRQWNGSPCSRAYGSIVFREGPVVKDSVRPNTGTPTVAPSTGAAPGGSSSVDQPSTAKWSSVLKRK